MAWQPLFEGLALSAGLIIAIGAQNAFVIRQGLTGQHVLAVALTCACCDIALITAGALGLGGFIAQSVRLRVCLITLGLGFLAWYGVTSWIRVWRKPKQTVQADKSAKTVGKIILLGLSFSLLNPQAIIDTVVLIGGLASQYEAASGRVAFTLGASLVSVVWFFVLAYGARLLQGIFNRRTTARIFDATVGSIMFILMGSLAYSEFLH